MKNRIRVITLALFFLINLFVMPVSVVYAEGEVNYDRLNEQIGIAKALNQADYETAAWEEFSAVLAQAEELTTSTEQDKVDEAAENLGQAIAKLQGVDRTKLSQALAAVEEYSQNVELSSLWYQMIGILDNAEEKILGTDQAAVDAAAVQVENMLAEISEAEKTARPGTIVQEVPVVVLPTDDYCNINTHNLGPILFVLSLIANVVLIAVMIIYVMRVLKGRKDDTPLVDYDIDDDLA